MECSHKKQSHIAMKFPIAFIDISLSCHVRDRTVRRAISPRDSVAIYVLIGEPRGGMIDA